MMNYCAQHKCRDEDVVGLARTYMGPDVQAYLDAKFKGTLPDEWGESRRPSGPDTCLLIIKSGLSSDLMV